MTCQAHEEDWSDRLSMPEACRCPPRQPVLPGVALALVLLVPTYSEAATVGSARTLSHLGEPLRVEIPIQTEGRFTDECVRLAPPAQASDDIPWVREARTIVSETVGGKRILITTQRPINSPAIMLGLQINCGIQLRREYALLLDPPEVQQLAELPVEPSSPPVSVSVAQTPGIQQAAGKDGGLRRTRAGETPASIAAELASGRRGQQQRLAEQIVASNRASLGNQAGVDTPFPEGSLISLPAVPPTSPRNESTPSRLTRSTTNAQPRAVPRLHIAEGNESGLQLSLSLGQYRELKETERDRLRTEMQLLSALDEKIATQIELSDRLRRLEALQEQLRSDATRLEAELQRQAQAASAGVAEPPTSSAPASAIPATKSAAVAPSSSRDQELAWLAGGLLALVLAIAGWLWLRLRHRDNTQDMPAADPQVQPTAAPAQDSMDELFEPLNEADIWPEREAEKAGLAGVTASPRAATAVEGALGPMSVASVGPTSVLQIEDQVEEHDSAVELAEIMMSFGRVHGAAQTLADFIRSNPKQAVKPWIKLLEVYRAANMRIEFDALCGQLNKTFNVKPVGWDDFEGALRAPESLENMPHIAKKLSDTWGKRECQAYLHELLRDNRQGTRQGFPLAIIDEILLLLAILESHLGAYRPDDESAPPPAVSTPNPDTVQVNTSENMIEPLDLNVEDPADKSATTGIDFDIDSMDLSKTLHINLDDLSPVDGQTSAIDFTLPDDKKPR